MRIISAVWKLQQEPCQTADGRAQPQPPHCNTGAEAQAQPQPYSQP